MSKARVFNRVTSISAIALLSASAMAVVPAYAKTNTNLPPLTISTGPNGNFLDNFNPFSSSPSQGTDGLLYQTLFFFDSVSGHTFSLLGTSFKWSQGNRTVTVTLRKNAKWSDGQPFTSKDVVFTFDLLKKYPSADLNSDWSQLRSVRALGLHKVVFHFKQPDSPFGNQFVLGDTYIVPSHIWSHISNPSKASVTKPIGSGPYLLKSFSPQMLTYSANNKFYSGAPAVKTVEYPAYSSNDSAEMALAKGDLQWATVMIPNIQKVYVDANPHNHYWFAPNVPNELYTNLQNPLLRLLPVREAISMALNRHAISVEGEDGYEKPASPTGLVLPTDHSWIDPHLPKSDSHFTYSPKAAEALLLKAGFKKNAQGIFQNKIGQPLSFTLQTVTGWSDWATDALLIKQELQKIGISVSVQQMSFGSYYGNIMPTGNEKKNYDLAIGWMNAGPTPFTAYFNMLDSHGNYNVEGLNNRAINGIFRNYLNSNNMAKEKQDIYKIERYFATQIPSVPLTDGAYWYEYNDANYTGWPTKSNPWIVGQPSIGQATGIILTHLKPVK